MEFSNRAHIHRAVCGVRLSGRVPSVCGRYCSLAAALTRRHRAAPTVPAHLSTAGTLRAAQMRMGKGAYHRRSNERQQNRQDQCELAQNLHLNNLFKSTISQVLG